jgi:hypothetical protein
LARKYPEVHAEEKNLKTGFLCDYLLQQKQKT